MSVQGNFRVLWSVSLRGDARFSCEIPGNPIILHISGTSAHVVFATGEEISELVRLGGNLGILVSPQVLPTPERKEAFEGVQADCERCLSCPWWDPVTLEPGVFCFFQGAPEESVRTLLENSPKHRYAVLTCPLKVGGSLDQNYDLGLVYYSKHLQREVVLGLVEAGEQVPWAAKGERVVFGPPLPEVHPKDLEWEVSRYYALSIETEEGLPVELPPEEYREAMLFAEQVTQSE